MFKTHESLPINVFGALKTASFSVSVLFARCARRWFAFARPTSCCGMLCTLNCNALPPPPFRPSPPFVCSVAGVFLYFAQILFHYYTRSFPVLYLCAILFGICLAAIVAFSRQVARVARLGCIAREQFLRCGSEYLHGTILPNRISKFSCHIRGNVETPNFY